MILRKKPTSAAASPTKAFFVSMLTRDISLADAILDLVDNSLDGALRSGATADSYDGYWVEIDLAPTQFSIRDNCGGIPRQLAAEYAFKMGREPDDVRDDEYETIGMYGIGMKRAVFKMGRSTAVWTRHGDDAFQVTIGSDWLDDKQWSDLPIETLAPAAAPTEPGTTILVQELFKGISQRFGAPDFEDELRKALGDHFTLFIQRGFRITLNSVPVAPTTIQILMDDDGPRPYFFSATVGSTIVRMAIGLDQRARSPAEQEPEEHEQLPDRRTVATAGWSVFCNDRAVVVGDTTRLTTWGDGAPLFHPQFRFITGIVEFRARDAADLPVTTTKRALDTSAASWMLARVFMRTGLKIYIRHTNKWKNLPRSTEAIHWSEATPRSLEQIASAMLANPERLTKSKKHDGALYYDPEKAKVLPSPKSKSNERRISFSKPIPQVQFIGRELLDVMRTRRPQPSARLASIRYMQNWVARMGSSGSSIAYHLRPNKAVERELFLDLLSWLAPALDFKHYLYIGMGGPFLEDFRLLHSRLNIVNMTCVERDSNTFRRQEFNRPSALVTCVEDDVAHYLQTTELSDQRCIVWLDFTTANEMRKQIELFVETAKDVDFKSILKLTLNAQPSNLDEGSSNTKTHDVLARRLERLRDRLGDFVPALATATDMTRRRYGPLLVECVRLALRQLLHGAGVEVVGLSSYFYSDGQPMITITVSVVEASAQERFVSAVRLRDWPLYQEQWWKPRVIDMPVLSARERLAVEQWLHDPTVPLKERLAYELPPGGRIGRGVDSLDMYSRFYRFYPQFGRVLT